MDFWFEFLDIHMNEKKKKIAMIIKNLNGKKHKYFSKLDYFKGAFDILFSLFYCDYTHFKK